jgi:hypothetical protein
MTNLSKLAILVAGFLGLTGCASTVQKSDNSKPTAVGRAAGSAIVLNITGSTTSTSSKDWADFQSLWREPCSEESAAVGASLSMQEGEAKPTGDSGTLVLVNIVDYRYVSTGARIMLGVMTGNAYINAEVSFRDLKSGEVRATKTYDTTSTAWQGIFSGMTGKQVRAMCHEIAGELVR